MKVYGIIGLIFACAPHLFASIVYDVTDLTATARGVPAGVLVTGSAINNTGQIAGYISFLRLGSMESSAILYTAGSATLINPPDVSYSQATAINDSGDAVGNAQGGVFRYHDGQTTFLGTLGSEGSMPDARLADINNHGEAVGCTSLEVGSGSFACRAFILNDGQIRQLGSLGGVYSSAQAINDAGQVAGTSFTSQGLLHAFLYQNGVMTDLGDLAGLGSSASAINDRGQIAGTSALPGYFDHAFLYEDGVMKDLSTLTGERSRALGINNKGQVVGEDSAGAFLYSEGRMFDLNSLIDPALGIHLLSADAINDLGVIVARGTSDATGQYSAGFVLTPAETAPVPEPAGLATTLAGILSISAVLVLRRSREDLEQVN